MMAKRETVGKKENAENRDHLDLRGLFRQCETWKQRVQQELRDQEEKTDHAVHRASPECQGHQVRMVNRVSRAHREGMVRMENQVKRVLPESQVIQESKEYVVHLERVVKMECQDNLVPKVQGAQTVRKERRENVGFRA